MCGMQHGDSGCGRAPAVSGSRAEAGRTLVALDTDIASDFDDVLCLLSLLSHRDEVELVAVTTVGKGAKGRQRVCRRVLAACGECAIPVYAGLERPWHEEPEFILSDGSVQSVAALYPQSWREEMSAALSDAAFCWFGHEMDEEKRDDECGNERQQNGRNGHHANDGMEEEQRVESCDRVHAVEALRDLMLRHNELISFHHRRSSGVSVEVMEVALQRMCWSDAVLRFGLCMP